jgi:hypothetical protein
MPSEAPPESCPYAVPLQLQLQVPLHQHRQSTTANKTILLFFFATNQITIHERFHASYVGDVSFSSTKY